MGTKPTAVHLERKLDRLRTRLDRSLVIGPQGIDFPQNTVRTEVADVEGDGRIAHPEAHFLGPVENEEHAFLLAQLFPIHEAALQFHRPHRHLHLRLDFADPEGKPCFEAGVARRPRPRRSAGREQKQQAAEETAAGGDFENSGPGKAGARHHATLGGG